jgi:Zn-dependent peptidase ImmA (M78 family)
MPERTFGAEIYGWDEESLIQAKKRWGVSMQAILMRLRSIGLISSHQLTRAFQQVNLRGQRRKEPLDGEMQPEETRLLRKAIEFANENRALELNEFLVGAGYPAWFLEQTTGLSRGIVSPVNVVPFKLRA